MTKLFCLFLLAAGLGAAQTPPPELHTRRGLRNVFAKLERASSERPVKIAYFGGSITAADGWRPLTFDWLRKEFPQARLEMLPASVGGTGSVVGAFRADFDLIRHKPDLVFVEFAVNDAGDARTQPEVVKQALEGIVRKIWRTDGLIDIVFVYTLQGPDVATLNSGKYQTAAALHEQLADHYGIPSVHLGVEVATLARQDELIFTAPATADGKTAAGQVIFTNDGTHPTKLGYEIYARAAIRGLDQLRRIAGDDPHVLPPPLTKAPWEKARTLAADGNARFSGAWDKITAQTGPACFRFGKRFYEWFPYLYRTEKPGSSVTIKFRGTHIGIRGLTGPDSGCISIQVDDRPATRECQFNVYGRMYAYGGSPLPELPYGEHTVTWTFLDDKPDKGAILASYPRPGNDQDFRDHPERYAGHRFSLGQILVIGDVLAPPIE